MENSSQDTPQHSSESGADKRARASRTASASAMAAKVRAYAARLVWLVCVLAALVLAVGALLIALKTNTENGLVKGILNLADVADVGVFDLANPIKKFAEPDAHIKVALLNYGLGALAWLVVGRILTWVLRPRS